MCSPGAMKDYVEIRKFMVPLVRTGCSEKDKVRTMPMRLNVQEEDVKEEREVA